MKRNCKPAYIPIALEYSYVSDRKMLDADLEREDMENAIFKGMIVKKNDACCSIKERLDVQVVNFNQATA